LEEQQGGYSEYGDSETGGCALPPCARQRGTEQVAPTERDMRRGLLRDAGGDAGFEAFGGRGSVEGCEDFVDRGVVRVGLSFHDVSSCHAAGGDWGAIFSLPQGLKPEFLLVQCQG
jgi:hypothetical protein